MAIVYMVNRCGRFISGRTCRANVLPLHTAKNSKGAAYTMTRCPSCDAIGVRIGIPRG